MTKKSYETLMNLWKIYREKAVDAYSEFLYSGTGEEYYYRNFGGCYGYYYWEDIWSTLDYIVSELDNIISDIDPSTLED